MDTEQKPNKNQTKKKNSLQSSCALKEHDSRLIQPSIRWSCESSPTTHRWSRKFTSWTIEPRVTVTDTRYSRPEAFAKSAMAITFFVSVTIILANAKTFGGATEALES